MDVGIVGLGRMGMGMAKRLYEAGHRVVVYNRSVEKVREAEKLGMVGAESLDTLVGQLARRRVIFVMVLAGQATEEMVAELVGLMEAGDILIDGGNSYWRDSVRRAEQAAKAGVLYLDQGTSGGLAGATQGYCLMVGGEAQAFDFAEPALKDLAMPKGYALVGPSGTGHFTKMVHNAVEYGMMEAVAEGIDLLKNGPYESFDLAQIVSLWQHGSIVSSYLMEVLLGQFVEQPGLDHVSSAVSDNGEGRWAIVEAMEYGVPFGVISEALFARYASRRTESFAGKVLSAMRLGFGGHTK